MSAPPPVGVIALALMGRTTVMQERVSPLALRQADAILSALAAAGHVIEQDWQPIETAPKDGTRFIAWWQPCAQLPNGGWHECQWLGGGWYHPFFAEPTHWKPPPVDGPHLTAAKETQA